MIYLLYNSFGFGGIYSLVLVITALISIALFNNLLKEKNNIILAFIVSMISVFCAKEGFAARNQIFSFLIFVLEISYLIGLLEQGKKRCFWYLIVLAFLLVLVHDTLYILFFVMMLPYLADIILSKIFKIDDLHKFKDSKLQNAKYLIILLIVAIPIGFCTPVFATTYTNLINCMSGISTSFINELKPINIIGNVQLLTITFLAIGMLGFTKTKFYIKDILFVFGFIISAMMVGRNIFFLYLIGMIYLTNMLTECINTYIGEEKANKVWELVEKSKFAIIVIFCFTSIISIRNLSYQLVKEYVSDIYYPKEATEWILKNVDYENMRIWNNFNWGSYLELNGIKVFIDSRSGMYTEQENKGCTVLNDWYLIDTDNADYADILNKYRITHVLLQKNEKINDYLAGDDNYNQIYEDGLFVLYEKVNIRDVP